MALPDLVVWTWMGHVLRHIQHFIANGSELSFAYDQVLTCKNKCDDVCQEESNHVHMTAI